MKKIIIGLFILSLKMIAYPQEKEKSFSENYKKGIEFYNMGVEIIKNIAPTENVIRLDEVQKKSIIQFKEALPYLVKAHELNPKDKNTLIALMGIYFSMDEKEKYNKCEKEFDSLNKK